MIKQLACLRRAVAVVAVIGGLGLPFVPAAAQEAFDPGEVKAIEGIIHDYFEKNPELVIEALRSYDRQQKELAAAKTQEVLAERRDELENDPDSFVGGNPEGDVTLVEFFDYRCPYCKRVFPTLTEVRKGDKNLRFVYKEFPILGPDSVTASKAAIASRMQGKYEQYHDALMASRGKLTETTIMQIAAEVGLDTDQLKSDMEAPEVNQIIARNYALAGALGINATPSFIIGDKLVPGAVELDALKDFIEQARTNCLTC